MPLGQGTRWRPHYFWAQLAHVAGSLSSAIVVGAGAGFVGSFVAEALPAQVAWLCLAGLSTLLALRELGWIRFPIPQWRRQTEKMWGFRFGPLGAAWWWGIDLGSGLTTHVTFSSYWLLVLAILFNGSAVYGGLVLGLYGLGRALPVSVVPRLLEATDPLWVTLNDLWQQYPHLHRWHRYGLAGLALGLVVRALILT